MLPDSTKHYKEIDLFELLPTLCPLTLRDKQISKLSLEFAFQSNICKNNHTFQPSQCWVLGIYIKFIPPFRSPVQEGREEYTELNSTPGQVGHVPFWTVSSCEAGDSEREKHQRWQWLLWAGEPGGANEGAREGDPGKDSPRGTGFPSWTPLQNRAPGLQLPSTSCKSPAVSSLPWLLCKAPAALAHWCSSARQGLPTVTGAQQAGPPLPSPRSVLVLPARAVPAAWQLPSAAGTALFWHMVLSCLPATGAVCRTCHFLICGTQERLLSPF